MKKRNDYNSIAELVQANTGMTVSELIDDTKTYKVDGLDEAAGIIRNYLDKKIYVVGDYDVDGVCASAIMYLLLKHEGANDVTVRLPRRFSEGYGMKVEMLDEFESGNLIVTVDNGIAAHEAVAKAKELGFTVIVTDHHLPVVENGEVLLPEADLVIDPNAVKGNTDFVSYCGAGIAYKLAETMTDDVFFLKKLMGLAAVATIADCMPLIHENRRIVKKGLRYIMDRATTTAGLSALIEKLNIEQMNTEKVSFAIAPALNAPGRLYDDGAMKSFLLIIAESDADAEAEALVEDNNQRKLLAKNGEADAIRMLADDGSGPVVVYMPEMCEGLCGIIAAKLAEKYHAPAFVLAGEGDVIKGSGRSYGGINLKELLDLVSTDLEGYGGHADAAGLSLKKDNLELFKKHLSEHIPEVKAEGREVYYDLEVKKEEIRDAIVELAKYEPYGEGNPAPVFLISNMHLVPRGNAHYKAFAEDSGIRFYAEEAEITQFSSSEQNAVASYEKMGRPRDINVVGTISTDTWNGRVKTQVIAEEIVPVAKERKPQSSLAMLLQKRAMGGREKEKNGL